MDNKTKTGGKGPSKSDSKVSDSSKKSTSIGPRRTKVIGGSHSTGPRNPSK